MANKKVTPKTVIAPVSAPHPITVATPVVDETFYARLVTGGDFAAGAITDSYLASTTTDTFALMTTAREQAQAIHQGDMTQVESMLIGQAVALQSMFVDFALRAKNASSLQAVQCLAQLALRSQAGSRSTLQTLAEVKNPRQVAFVKQTNVAHTQQVNNGVPPPSASHTEKIVGEPNELLVETPHGSKKMDRRAKAKAGRADPAMVPMD